MDALLTQNPARAEQATALATLIDAGAACFVPITVVLELEWLLRGACRLPREAVITAFDGLLSLLHLEQENLIGRALEWDRQGMDCGDALHLMRSESSAALQP